MTKIRLGAAALGLSFAAMAATGAMAQTSADETAELLNVVSSEGVVSSESSCEYEGGTVMTLESGKICFIAVRGEALNSAAYDGQRLGVIKCSDNGGNANELVQPSGDFCRVYLEQKKVAPSRAEIEAQTRATMEKDVETVESN